MAEKGRPMPFGAHLNVVLLTCASKRLSFAGRAHAARSSRCCDCIFTCAFTHCTLYCIWFISALVYSGFGSFSSMTYRLQLFTALFFACLGGLYLLPDRRRSERCAAGGGHCSAETCLRETLAYAGVRHGAGARNGDIPRAAAAFHSR